MEPPASKRPKTDSSPSILLIEPFYGGSHKQMLDLICAELTSESFLLLTLPAKKWKWRLRTSSAFFADKIPQAHGFSTLFCSSMLNLSELVSLRPDLIQCNKIIYFHENQFEYPVQPGAEKERDVQFGWSQAISCMSADKIFFNSSYNMESFLDGLTKSIKLMPKEQQSLSMVQKIRNKSQVLYYPLRIDTLPTRVEITLTNDSPIHIVWNHRWEWDKGPDDFFKAISLLEESQLPYQISVLGESFGEVPDVFEKAKAQFGHRIKNWGYCSSKEEYFQILLSADIVVSTAHHEFFGVSIVEAIACGCFPLCPNRLVFPEYIPKDSLYNTTEQLVKQLRYYCRYPNKLRMGGSNKEKADILKFDWMRGGIRDNLMNLLGRAPTSTS